jgi:ABC-2 type transport system ATP-binding protein
MSTDVPLLEVSDLCYAKQRRSILSTLSFSVHEGEMVGVLGPNGAGKTSLLKVLMGLLPPDRGSVSWEGVVLDKTAWMLRKSTGVVFQEPSLDKYLSCEENLLLAASMYGLSASEAESRVDALLDFVGLKNRASEVVSVLSGGMKRRLELARALLHKPKLLLLDEPTAGLDALASRMLWDMLKTLCTQERMAVLVSTHISDEMQKMDRVLLLHGGCRVAFESPALLMERMCEDWVVLDVQTPDVISAEVVRSMGLDGTVEEGHVTVRCEKGHTVLPRLVEAFPSGAVRSALVRKPTLADVYWTLTGTSLQAGE